MEHVRERVIGSVDCIVRHSRVLLVQTVLNMLYLQRESSVSQGIGASN